MQHPRRILLLAFLSAFALPSAAQRLREAAERTHILIGAAVNAAYLSESAYTATLAREFNMLEPEDAMKWAVLRPEERAFNFSEADRLVAFAENHGMKVRGHNLVWGTHNPQWLTAGHFPPERLRALLHDHINHVVGHYQGKVFAWDVVNEAFDEDGQLRDSIWYNRPGIEFAANHTAYIEQSFRWAHEADARALLFYNDADAEMMNRKSDAIYAMVKDFKQRGVPIDGVGLQMHIFNLRADIASIEANIERLTALGVQVHITEMDVAVPVDGSRPRDPKDLERQAEIYREIATVCLRSSGCTALQTWGFTDKYSWLGWFTRGRKGDGLIFDCQYRAKPAYQALRNTLATAPAR